MVNSFGQVFEANAGEVEDDHLPRLAGPHGSSARVLAMHQALLPALQPLQLALETLTLTPRGLWRAELAGGIVIELGRGEVDEVAARAAQFARTLPQVSATYQRALLYADLRHTDGYAVRLKGITTFANPAKN
jgi:cell division protein FtsQ